MPSRTQSRRVLASGGSFRYAAAPPSRGQSARSGRPAAGRLQPAPDQKGRYATLPAGNPPGGFPPCRARSAGRGPASHNAPFWPLPETWPDLRHPARHPKRCHAGCGAKASFRSTGARSCATGSGTGSFLTRSLRRRRGAARVSAKARTCATPPLRHTPQGVGALLLNGAGPPRARSRASKEGINLLVARARKATAWRLKNSTPPRRALAARGW